MLIEDYRSVHMGPPECSHDAQTLAVIAEFPADVSPILPYLNATLGGYQFPPDQGVLVLRVRGKTINIYPDKVTITHIKDQEEGWEILEWLKVEINTTYARRHEIIPSYQSRPLIGIIDIMKYLPKTNCRDCSESTCLAFAVRLRAGEIDPRSCPVLGTSQLRALQDFLTSCGWTLVDYGST
jgi:ArsR family metal-binding transcriptional regulator